MRHWTTATLGLVLGLSISLTAAIARAQSATRPHRPQAKIIERFDSAADASVVIGVIGQVGRPGTYQFASPPTLELVVANAEGITADAFDMIRIVRGQRAQMVAVSSAANETLKSGDLVVVDGKTSHSRRHPKSGDEYVWVALTGVTKNRPYVVPVKTAEAHPELLVQKLGQPAELLSTVKVLRPPTAALQTAPGMPLADGTVLFFDASQIRASDLPADLPPILPCGLPEPDIGGYGVHNAYEEQYQQEPLIPRQTEAPRFGVLPPTPDQQMIEPTPIPLPDEPSPPISTAKQSTGSPPISTVPYSREPAPIAARRNRLTGLAPSPKSTAIDTQSPAWNSKSQATGKNQLSDLELEDGDAPRKAAGALSGWQMLAIVASAGLLVGLALGVRALQTKSKPQMTSVEPTPVRTQTSPVAATPPMVWHAEASAVVPAPHLPPESFLAAAASRIPAVENADKAELGLRQVAFSRLLNHEFPVIEEPLALRPGIRLGAPSAVEQPIRRWDEGEPRAETIAPALPAASILRPHLDAPHPRTISGPHLRIGPEAPVERALRQLQGGRS